MHILSSVDREQPEVQQLKVQQTMPIVALLAWPLHKYNL